MRSRLLTISVVVALAGCAASGVKSTDANVVESRLAPGKGRFYFYRGGSIAGVAVQPEIKLNNEPVGRAVPGGFFFADRPRGSYEASTATEIEACLRIDPGETKYVRVSISPGILVRHIQFELVDRAIAEVDLASLKKV